MKKRVSSIVLEGAVFDVPKKYKKYNDGKIVAECYLQTADEKNQNRRIYPRNVLDQGMRAIQQKIDDRRFVGELDHPISDQSQRQTTVEYKNASHLIREWWWDGNRIKGIVETLPYTPSGKIMSGLISDEIPVGFSLRGLADVENMGGYQQVQAPLIVISYDCVSEPSHKGSQVSEIRQEGAVIPLKEGSKGLKILSEAKDFYMLSNGRTYTANALDMLIEKKIITLANNYLYE